MLVLLRLALNICLLQCVIECIYFANASTLLLLDSHYAMHYHLEIEEERIYNWKQAGKIYGLQFISSSVQLYCSSRFFLG